MQELSQDADENKANKKNKRLEIVADCGYIKEYALLIGQQLRGDFDGEIQGNPGFSDKFSLDELKVFAERMVDLAEKVDDYVKVLNE